MRGWFEGNNIVGFMQDNRYQPNITPKVNNGYWNIGDKLLPVFNVLSDTAYVINTSTNLGGTWKVKYIDNKINSNASVNITSLVAGTPQTQNFTVTGVTTGQKVTVYDTAGTVLSSTVVISKAYVSAANTVTLEFNRLSGSTADVTGNLQIEVK